jgi:hypothetical protein
MVFRNEELLKIDQVVFLRSIANPVVKGDQWLRNHPTLQLDQLRQCNHVDEFNQSIALEYSFLRLGWSGDKEI